MKKVAIVLAVAVVGLAVAAGSPAQAAYVSTFNIVKADFSLTGFSTGTGPTTSTPTTGPVTYAVTNVDGTSTYSLDIPPAGTSWDVYSSGQFMADFDKNGTWDANDTWNEYLGNFVSPGPSTFWGPGSIPFTVEYGGTPYNFVLDYQVTVDGAYPLGNFGSNASATLTMSGDPTGMLLGNTYLTNLDNMYGGGDGIIDGWISYNQTITAIPEPASVLVWCLLGAGSWLGMRVWRRRKWGATGAHWTEENRQAIRQIVDRGRLNG